MKATFLRAWKFALQNFTRNIWLSLVTVLILFLTLLTISVSFSLNIVARQAVGAVKDKVDVSVYFVPDALPEDISLVRERIASLPEVAETSVITREEALKRFQERVSGNTVIEETLSALGENPLGATLVVRADAIEDYPAILAVLDDPSFSKFIEDRDYEESQLVVERLTAATNTIERVGIGVSILFSIIAILVVFNTIRIAMYSYRDEIGIMKLVGATNSFVRAPFILESVIYALLATLLTTLAFVFLLGVSSSFLTGFFAGYDIDLLGFFQNNFASLVVGEFLVALILSVLSSMIAVTRHLRV